jgi:hypothetical protein
MTTFTNIALRSRCINCCARPSKPCPQKVRERQQDLMRHNKHRPAEGLTAATILPLLHCLAVYKLACRLAKRSVPVRKPVNATGVEHLCKQRCQLGATFKHIMTDQLIFKICTLDSKRSIPAHDTDKVYTSCLSSAGLIYLRLPSSCGSDNSEATSQGCPILLVEQ